MWAGCTPAHILILDDRPSPQSVQALRVRKHPSSMRPSLIHRVHHLMAALFMRHECSAVQSSELHAALL